MVLFLFMLMYILQIIVQFKEELRLAILKLNNWFMHDSNTDAILKYKMCLTCQHKFSQIYT